MQYTLAIQSNSTKLLRLPPRDSTQLGISSVLAWNACRRRKKYGFVYLIGLPFLVNNLPDIEADANTFKGEDKNPYGVSKSCCFNGG